MSVNEARIIRVEKTENYSIICNRGIRDARLSWGARGILCYALSRPDNWELTVNDLIGQAPEGRDAVKGMLQELKRFGYFKKEQRRIAGRFVWVGTLYEVSQEEDFSHEKVNEKSPENRGQDSPSTENPSLVPSTAKPSTVKPSIYKKDKEVLNKEGLTSSGGVLEPDAAPPPRKTNLSEPKYLTTVIGEAIFKINGEYPNLRDPRDQKELKRLVPLLKPYPSHEEAAREMQRRFEFWNKSHPPKLSQIVSQWHVMGIVAEKHAKKQDDEAAPTPLQQELEARRASRYGTR